MRAGTPESNIDTRIDDVDLSEFKSATMKQAPLQGTMLGRFKFHRKGSSIHKFAANSEGAMSVVIPHGQISDVIAELTGINVLKVLGLLLAKGHAKLRFAAASSISKTSRGRSVPQQSSWILPTCSSRGAAKSISTAKTSIYPCREIPRK